MSNETVTNRPMTTAEWATLVFLSILWGGSFFFNAVGVKELPVFTVVVGRVALAAVLMLGLLRIMGLKLPSDRRIWAAFFGIGLLNNAIPFSLIVGGQQHIASGVASILNAATPLFTVLFAHFLTADEKMTGNRLIGVLIGFFGVAVMVGLDAVQALGSHVTAQLMCLSATVSYALASIYGRRFRAMGVPPLVTATGQVAAASVLLVPVMLLVDRPWELSMPGPAALGAVAGLAVLSTALAYVLFFRLLASAGASNLALVTFLVPVSAILLGFLFLDEVLTPRHLAGMALIGLGLAAIDGRPWRAIRRLASPAVGRR
ncbi:DMT family transporter [Aquamicrobium ahrensii]|uniref:Drug/metabolite transporter (DMT)-like permease n=1 Tax=Aquamicrobium ahrensii TaxID=469551 RepID=A0ABV2KKC8_9HYPH